MTQYKDLEWPDQIKDKTEDKATDKQQEENK